MACWCVHLLQYFSREPISCVRSRHSYIFDRYGFDGVLEQEVNFFALGFVEFLFVSGECDFSSLTTFVTARKIESESISKVLRGDRESDCVMSYITNKRFLLTVLWEVTKIWLGPILLHSEVESGGNGSGRPYSSCSPMICGGIDISPK